MQWPALHSGHSLWLTGICYSVHTVSYTIFYEAKKKSLGKLTFSFQDHFCTEQVTQQSYIPILNETCL